MVRAAMDEYIREHRPVATDLFSCIENKKMFTMSESLVGSLRSCMHDVIDTFITEDRQAFLDQHAVVADEFISSDLDAILLARWTFASLDPAKRASLWMYTGAPGGMPVHFDLEELLDPADDGDVLDPFTIKCDHAVFQNNCDFDRNPVALDAMRDMASRRGWLRVCKSKKIRRPL